MRDSATLLIKRAIAIGENGEKQDHAEVKLEPVVADLQHQEPAADRGHQQGPEHGAGHRHRSARKRRAAEHRPEERGQQPVLAADRRHRRAKTRDHHHARRRRQQTRERVADRDDAIDRHARHFGGAGVGARGEDLPAQNGMAIEDEQQQADRQSDDEQRRHEAGDLHFSERADLRRQAVERDRLGQNEHGAGVEIGARQRDDEGADAAARDDEPIEPAERGAEPERADDGDRDRQCERLHEVAAGHHGADADRADGQIHAPCRERRHLREADHDVDRQRASDREEIERRHESRRAPGEHGPKGGDDDHEAELRGNPAQAEAPTRRHFAHGFVGHAFINIARAPVGNSEVGERAPQRHARRIQPTSAS